LANRIEQFLHSWLCPMHPPSAKAQTQLNAHLSDFSETFRICSRREFSETLVAEIPCVCTGLLSVAAQELIRLYFLTQWRRENASSDGDPRNTIGPE
jgi:hypothetical protein